MTGASASDVLANRLGRSRYIAVVFALAAVIGGCSGPEPTPTTESGSDSTTTSNVPDTTAPPETTTTDPPPDPPVVDAAFPQSGAAAPLWDDDGYGSDTYSAALEGLAEAGASWVTVIPTWYQTDADSSSIYREQPGRTATDEALASAISRARALGMRVTLKPHVDLAGGGSRISIDPADEGDWFDSYTDMIVGYAEMAEEAGVDQFVVGTELGGTSGSEQEWREVITRVREAYSGPITYAANHDEFEDVAFWDAVDFIGVDAYFPLSDVPTTIISDLTRAWEPIVADLAVVSERFGRMIVFTEVGYPSQEGATVEPYNPSHSDVVSEAEQAAALEAMIIAVGSEQWFGGFHWWMWFVERTDAAAALSYMPAGKPAGDILEAYWAETGS